MAFENLKTKFDQWSVRQRFNDKMQSKVAKKKAQQEALNNALANPDDHKQYKRALHQLARQETAANYKAFGKWLLTDLVWLIVPYAPYSVWSMILNQTIILPRMNARLLWAIQERLMLIAILVGVFSLVALNQIIKNGWFHRPYKKGDLLDYVNKVQQEHQHHATQLKKAKRQVPNYHHNNKNHRK